MAPPPPDRRDFLQLASAALLGGCAAGGRAPDAAAPRPAATDPSKLPEDSFDYVVVGSGAGGGPLAANLALAGYKVLLLEAGGEDEGWNYQVPAFHALATEDDALRWSFYVRHYADEARQRRDPKFVAVADGAARDGVLYPRAATLGGCTAHNAMILVYPHNSDWDGIAAASGDPSWNADAMRGHFERIERNGYRRRPPGADPARHGYDGWLPTHTADPTLLVRDKALARVVAATLRESGAETVHDLGELARRIELRFKNQFDPNDWRWVEGSYTGLTFTPLTTDGGRRSGARERVRAVQAVRPEHLVVRTHALATRVLLDGGRRAVGVEYLHAPHLYRADPAAAASGPAPAVERVARAVREVVLAGGAFNTPQLLMLSGIGPRGELERQGIAVQVELPGVGRNLQDRYEVSVVSRMKDDFRILDGARFRPPAAGEVPDRAWSEWLEGEGVYTTNGAVIASVGRSAPARPEPDLYLFGLVGRFEGYFPGYSALAARDRNHFSWAVLKAHTDNSAGTVGLRSADPRDPPLVNFRYFQEGNDPEGDDLDSVAAGVDRVRRIMARVPDLVAEEVLPGPAVASRDQVRGFVRDNAWGHHASCTCKIGGDGDPTAVLDGRLRVRGTRGLRVVDASVFPRIPGFFIVSAVYMVGEKASGAILADAPGWS